MVFDKRKRFTDRSQFLEWYNVLTKWEEDVDYNDYKHTTTNLQQWFLEMKDIVPPLNGEFASRDAELGNSSFQEGDYCIAKEAIYVAFSWSDAEKAHQIVMDLAKKHDVAFLDISGDSVIYPDGFVLDLSDSHSKSTPSFFQKIRRFLRI